jgi:hypothetical protein
LYTTPDDIRADLQLHSRPENTMHLILALLGCQPAFVVGDTATDDTGPVDTDTDTDDTDTDTDTDDTGDTDPEALEWPFGAVEIDLHDDVNTVLEVNFALQADAQSSWIAFTFEDDTWQETPSTARDVGEHTEVLLGIPQEVTVTVELYAEIDGTVHVSSRQLEAETDSLPSNLDDADLQEWDPDETDPEPWILTSVDVGSSNFYGPCYTVIIDRMGRVVWYRLTSDSRLTMFPKVSEDGTHILIDATTYYTFNGDGPSVTRTTLDQTQEEVREIDRMGLTYDELPDGTILYDYNTDGTRYSIHALYPDDTDEEVWSCYDWMDSFRSVGYWDCAANTVLWNEGTNTILYSMFQTSTVVEVSWETGEVIRQFGQLEGAWAVDPASSNLDLQHYPNYTDAGTLIVSTHVPGQSYQQRAREFVVNDETQTLEEIWTYAGSGYYAEYAGEAKRLASGHTLQGFGTDGAIQEVNAQAQLVWGVEWRDSLLGTATPVADLYALNEGGW